MANLDPREQYDPDDGVERWSPRQGVIAKTIAVLIVVLMLVAMVGGLIVVLAGW